MDLVSEGKVFALSQLVEGNPVATIIVGADHRVIHWNRACEVLTGVSAAEMIGSNRQWRAFYGEARPILADLIIDDALEGQIDRFYHGKFRKSVLIDGAYEAEDFFPAFGEDGRWLFFTAAPIRNAEGQIVGAIETLQDVSARRRAEEALKESEERYRRLSLTDPLTGLLNFRSLQERMLAEIERATRYDRPLSLLVIDCDDFKVINDTFGHLEGDKVLQALAEVIRQCLRRSDSAYRYGGEEFIALLPEINGEGACRLAERLRKGFAEQSVQSNGGATIRCTISIGVAEWLPGEDDQALIRRADQAVYEAKRRGKNCVMLASATPD